MVYIQKHKDSGGCLINFYAVKGLSRQEIEGADAGEYAILQPFFYCFDNRDDHRILWNKILYHLPVAQDFKLEFEERMCFYDLYKSTFQTFCINLVGKFV